MGVLVLLHARVLGRGHACCLGRLWCRLHCLATSLPTHIPWLPPPALARSTMVTSPTPTSRCGHCSPTISGAPLLAHARTPRLPPPLAMFVRSVHGRCSMP